MVAGRHVQIVSSPIGLGALHVKSGRRPPYDYIFSRCRKSLNTIFIPQDAKMAAPPAEFTPPRFNPYGYVPSKPASIAFIALFGITTIAHLGQTLFSRRRVWWTLVFTAGGLMEIIGWIGRLQSSSDPYSSNAFVMQIVTLVIAPAWLSAGCYQVTGSLIYRIGREGSPLSARAYTIIFVLCDVVSIMLQSAGGAAAGNDARAGRSPDKGRLLLLAGVAFQLVAMVIYLGLSLRFFKLRWMEFSPLRRRLIYGTIFGSLCIIVRGILRTTELAEGWRGYIFIHETFTIFLDGLPILLCMIGFNVVHPAYTLDADDSKLSSQEKGNEPV